MEKWIIITTIVSVVVIASISLRIFIHRLEKRFEHENSVEKKKNDKMAVEYLKEHGDDMVGFANAIVYVNRQSNYVKENLQKYSLYWPAKILAYPLV